MTDFPKAAFALFCDDIRAEQRGTNVLVGVYSEPIGFSKFPVRLRDIHMYARIAYDPRDLPSSVGMQLKLSSGETISSTELNVKEMAEFGQAAIEDGDPFATMTVTFIVAAREIQKPEKIIASLISNEDVRPIGFIEFALVD